MGLDPQCFEAKLYLGLGLLRQQWTLYDKETKIEQELLEEAKSLLEQVSDQFCSKNAWRVRRLPDENKHSSSSFRSEYLTVNNVDFLEAMLLLATMHFHQPLPNHNKAVRILMTLLYHLPQVMRSLRPEATFFTKCELLLYEARLLLWMVVARMQSAKDDSQSRLPSLLKLKSIIQKSKTASSTESVPLQLQLSKMMVHCCPQDIVAVAHLGASQLQMYDLNPTPSSRETFLKDAKASFEVCLDFENAREPSPDSAAPVAKIQEQTWFKDMVEKEKIKAIMAKAQQPEQSKSNAKGAIAKAGPNLTTKAKTKEGVPPKPEPNKRTPMAKGSAPPTTTAKLPPKTETTSEPLKSPSTTSDTSKGSRSLVPRPASGGGVGGVKKPSAAPKATVPKSTPAAVPSTQSQSSGPPKSATTSKAPAEKPKAPQPTTKTVVSEKRGTAPAAPNALKGKECTSKAHYGTGTTSVPSKEKVDPKNDMKPNQASSITKAIVPKHILYDIRLGLSRVHVRFLQSKSREEQTNAVEDVERIKALYKEAIQLEPKLYDPYIELGGFLADIVKDIESALQVYDSYPFDTSLTGMDSQDDIFLYTEMVSLLMRQKLLKDPRLVKALIGLGRTSGINVIKSYLEKIEETNDFETLRRIFAGTKRKKVEDPELVAYFKAKSWL
jgi:hypothetical protein